VVGFNFYKVLLGILATLLCITLLGIALLPLRAALPADFLLSLLVSIGKTATFLGSVAVFVAALLSLNVIFKYFHQANLKTLAKCLIVFFSTLVGLNLISVVLFKSENLTSILAQLLGPLTSSAIALAFIITALELGYGRGITKKLLQATFEFFQDSLRAALELLSVSGRQILSSLRSKPKDRKNLEVFLPKPQLSHDLVQVEKTPAKSIEAFSEVSSPKKEVPKVLSFSAKKKSSNYRLPPLSIFSKGEDLSAKLSSSEIEHYKNKIEQSLSEFGIQGKVCDVHPGPVVTTFEFEPAPGTKIGRIAILQDDLAMSLKAQSIRIVAPIPKKGTVGIEVPNKSRSIVRLRNVLESQVFKNAQDLVLAIGVDTTGQPVALDLSQMPHLLIAGATGTGKSVCINSLLISLLIKNPPDNLGLVLIDPKVLELSVYEGIPHLKAPVITETRQAKVVLQWAVKEMERRYRYLQQFGVRNLDNFNQTANDKLQKIVIIIDELADLMFTGGREVEELIIRLAQKARAAGIHLIMATQRPSVDVVTGLIKANFPARISFRVVSRVDSRTILDQMGAEKLLGRGDMLIMLPGGVGLKRAHGAFVSDSEVSAFTEALKANGPSQYDLELLEMFEALAKQDETSGDDFTGDSDEDLYAKALEIIVKKGQASTSMIQRALRIGYNRAARLVERMEQEGLLGPSDGIRPREVLYQNIKKSYPNLSV